MRLDSLRASTIVTVALASLSFSCGSPAPTTVPSAPPAAVGPPPAELSTIAMPVRASLTALVPLIEQQVPKSFVKLDAYELDPQGRFGLKYKVVRDPISLYMQGAGLHADLVAHYGIEGCVRAKNPVNGTYSMWPCISCGLGKEPMRDAIVRLQTRLDWNDNWTMRSKTTALPVEFPSRCRVTFAGIDITDWKLGPIVNEQLQSAVATIDRNTPAVTNVRKEAQQIWSAVQAPYEIAPRTWLVVEPAWAAVAPITGSGLNVTSALTLVAKTRVVVGEKPVVTAQPLPPLRRTDGSVAGGVRIPLDFEVSYADAGRFLTTQFGGKTYDVGGAKLTVDSIALSRGTAGKVAVQAAIDYRGGKLKRYSGLIFLEGTPLFDAKTGSAAIGDLEYSLDPKKRNPFTRAADHLAHDAVRARLRGSARWPLGVQIDAIRSEIQRGLSRQLAPNVALHGRVDSLQPVSVTPLDAGLSIRVLVLGAAEVEIR